jgi:hypothetical protein
MYCPSLTNDLVFVTHLFCDFCALQIVPDKECRCDPFELKLSPSATFTMLCRAVHERVRATNPGVTLRTMVCVRVSVFCVSVVLHASDATLFVVLCLQYLKCGQKLRDIEPQHSLARAQLASG